MPSRLKRTRGLGFLESSRPSVLLAVIVALLAALAVLQYRWIGELSDFQRAQMERTLRTSTDRFARDLERELEELFYVFSVPGERRASAEIAEDYAEWLESGGIPELIANAYWVSENRDAGPGVSLAERFTIEAVTVETGAFTATSWPALLEPLRPLMAASADAHQRREFHRSDSFTVALDDQHLAFVVAQTDLWAKTWGVAVLRRQVLDQQLFANLVRDHFGAEGQREFDLRLIDEADDDRLVYTSAPTPVAAADLTPDYTRHLDDFGGTFVIDADDRDGEDDDRSLAVVVNHRAGSVDTAVGQLRRRNLAFSFGVVLVLAAGVGVLAVAARRARRLAERQMEFVAGVSHELRTPIAGISSLSQNLADGVVQDLDQAARYGKTIHVQSKRLANMVEGVLHFSAIRSGRYRYTMQPVDVRSLINDALESIDPTGSEGPAPIVRLARNLPPLRGDERALRSVVRNLVSNALKFSGEGGEVRISAAPAGAHTVELSIADTGPGISAAEKARIFEPFFRGRHAEAQQIEGSGLGLSLVREIVRAHGGRIEVDSVEGRGSTFRVRLPVAEAATEPATRQPSVTAEGLRPAGRGGEAP